MPRIPLSLVAEAYIAMVLAEHARETRGADQRRDERMAVLGAEHNIPDGTPVSVEPRTADGPAHLVYEAL